MKPIYFLYCFCILGISSIAQGWSLKLSSNVELRTWKLTSTSEKTEKGLAGASIKLLKGGAVVTQLNSGSNGDFTVDVPPNGEYLLEVSYPGCNTKRFSISTNGVPEDVAGDNFLPTYSIGGFIMAKPFPGIDYSYLQKPLVKVIYFKKGQKFNDEESTTEAALDGVGRIAEAENALIEKFCSTNKQGDAALAKPDCPLAKSLYEKAIALIPGESYPVEQLAKVGGCLEKAAKEKEVAEKPKADQALALNTKVETKQDKPVKEKKVEVKASGTVSVTGKAEVKTKSSAQTTTTPVSANEKVLKQKGLTPEESAEQKKQAEKRAKATEHKQKQKEGMAKSKAEDEAAIKAEYEAYKAKKEAKEKADAEAAAAEKEKDRLTREQAIKEGYTNPDQSNREKTTPKPLGANQYKETIKKADDFFKMKRWSEAKAAYEDALKEKPGDPYATDKLEQANKNLVPK